MRDALQEKSYFAYKTEFIAIIEITQSIPLAISGLSLKVKSEDNSFSSSLWIINKYLRMIYIIIGIVYIRLVFAKDEVFSIFRTKIA